MRPKPIGQISLGLLLAMIGIFAVYMSPYTYSLCLRYVVDCPYYRREYLEALGYAMMFLGAALVGTVGIRKGG